MWMYGDEIFIDLTVSSLTYVGVGIGVDVEVCVVCGVLLADLPGVTLESLELQVQDNKLTLFGRVQQDLPSNARMIHQEYALGHFLRSFILSEEVDHERVTAKLNQGVLEVFLPRLPKAEPRRIPVTTN